MRTTLVALAATLALLLAGCKTGEAANDNAPEHVAGRVDFKTDADAPVPGGTGRKCTYGALSVVAAAGTVWVCAKSQDDYDNTAVGDLWQR